ncbi:MAG: tetratricopeptide repeat protein [Planctomycetota bacterium]
MFTERSRSSLSFPAAAILSIATLGCALRAETRPQRSAERPAVDSVAADEVGDLIEQGRRALEAKRFAEAERIFDEAARKDGSTPRTRMWVIRSWMESGRINDSLNAIDALDREGLKGPAIDYLYGMAFALKARGYIAAGTGGIEIQMSLDDGVMYLERALKSDPELARDAFLPLAEAAWYGQQLEVARPAAEKAVARAPQDPDAHFMLGRIALSQYGAERVTAENEAAADATWETARKSFAKAAELLGHPTEPALVDQLARIRVDLGHTYVWKRDFDFAQQEYAQAISWKPSLVDMARVHSLLGGERFLAAMESAASAIGSRAGVADADVATVQWWLGFARYEQKQYEQADRAFSSAVAKLPGYVNSWFYIMLSRYHQRDYEGAVAALRRHFEEDPADLVASIGASAETNLRIVDFLVGWLAGKQRAEEAAILTEVQTGVEPGNTRFWNNLGLFRRDAGDALRDSDRPGAADEALVQYEKAWQAYGNALEIEPENPAFLNDAAVILHYCLDREPDRAKAMYEKASERAEIELARRDLTPEMRDIYRIALRDSKNNLEKLARGDKRQ